MENNASEYWIGSVLSQEGKPIGFPSRNIIETEWNYAHIEKEQLAIIIGLQKFHHYTYKWKNNTRNNMSQTFGNNKE